MAQEVVVMAFLCWRPKDFIIQLQFYPDFLILNKKLSVKKNHPIFNSFIQKSACIVFLARTSISLAGKGVSF